MDPLTPNITSLLSTPAVLCLEKLQTFFVVLEANYEMEYSNRLLKAQSDDLKRNWTKILLEAT
jgi:hypothetical protein